MIGDGCYGYVFDAVADLADEDIQFADSIGAGLICQIFESQTAHADVLDLTQFGCIRAQHGIGPVGGFESFAFSAFNLIHIQFATGRATGKHILFVFPPRRLQR